MNYCDQYNVYCYIDHTNYTLPTTEVSSVKFIVLNSQCSHFQTVCYLIQVDKFVEFADIILWSQLSLEPYNIQGPLIWSVAVFFAEGIISGNLYIELNLQ